jgi:hypothetical protein
MAPKAASSLCGILSFLGITISKLEALSFVATICATITPPRGIPSTIRLPFLLSFSFPMQLLKY